MRCTVAAIVIFMSISQVEARPQAWCGWYLANYFGFTGALARDLWLARNWARIFPAAPLAPGNVAVFARGRGGHVGEIKAVRPGEVLLHSGNDGGAVRTRWRSTRRLIAVVKPTHVTVSVNSKRDQKRQSKWAPVPALHGV